VTESGSGSGSGGGSRDRILADPRSSLGAIAVLLLTSAAATWALYGRVLRLWWTNDDFYVLHVLRGRSLAEAFLSPGVWRQSRMFTPLLMLSFDADLRAFGLRPEAFYAHQLLALAAAAAAVAAVLRLWLPWTLALVASLLFLSGVPTIAWAQELLVRHYAEGLILAAFATRLFVLSIRRGRRALAWGSGLLYLGAMLEKEVYVPLAALLLLLPEGEPRTRLRRLLPHAAAFAAYLAGRYAVLGALGGGYGWTVEAGELPGLIAGLPAKVARQFAGGNPAWDALLLAVLAVGIAAAVRDGGRRAAGLLAAALALSVAPIAPVSKAFQPRYAVLAWLAVVVAFAFGCAALLRAGARSRSVGIALAAAACVAAAAVHVHAGETSYAAAGRMSAEGRFFLSMRDGDWLRRPAIPAAAMNELRWLKEDALGLPRGSGWFADDVYLCDHADRISRMYEFRDVERAVVDATSVLPAQRSRYCASIRDAPLEAAFTYAGGDFSWELGPYASGGYAIVYGDGIERFDVARRDGYRHHASVFTVRIRYESPEGWRTFSPDIPLDFRASPRIRWERAARRAS